MLRNQNLSRRLLAAVAVVGLCVVSSVPSGAADPQQVADDRFAAMDGPLAPFVVTPDEFDIDATRVLADIPALIDQVDADALVDWTTGLAGMFRSSESTQAELDTAAEWVTEQFTDLGYEPELTPVQHNGRDMPNISVDVPGTACSDRVLILSAHYDAKGPNNPGADDDATGMAGLFEIARILRDNPQPVTIRLVAFSFEEDGLIGSFSMAGDDADAGTDIVGAVSMDMLGYTDPDQTDPFVGMPSEYLAMAADPSSAVLAKAFGAGTYTYTPEFPAAAAIIDPGIMTDIFRSDHAPFVAQGWQGLLVTDTGNFRNPYYHTDGDTLDTIDWEFLHGSTRAVLAGLLTYTSSDQSGNGKPDLCASVLPPPSETDGADDPEGTGTPDGPTPGTADPAEPVSARATYTG